MSLSVLLAYVKEVSMFLVALGRYSSQNVETS